jgi:AraC-like DNA-binding protein
LRKNISGTLKRNNEIWIKNNGIGIMFISAKLKEANKTVVNIDLLDHFTKTPVVTDKKHEVVDYKLLDGKYFVYYTDGFCILRCNYDVAHKCTDQIIIKEDYIHISLLASGSFKVSQKGEEVFRSIMPGSLQFAYLPDHDIEMEMSAINEKLNYTRIFLSKKFFLGLLENEFWVEKDLFFNEVKNNRYVNFGKVKIPMNLGIIEILNEIAENAHEGSLGHYYLLSKLKELFLMSHIFQSEKVLPDHKKADELKKLEQAKIYLEKYYSENPTIKQVSRVVLLNEFKLKNGFKEIYNCTIHAYMTQLRMEQARKMLLEENTVNDVSLTLGYKSVSHFIVSFRKYFGVTPKQISLSNMFNDGKSKVICFLVSFLVNDLSLVLLA